MRLIFFLISMSCALYLILGLYGISRGSKIRSIFRSPMDIVFSILCFMLAAGSLGSAFFVSANSEAEAASWFYIFAFAWYFSPTIFLLFVLELCNLRSKFYQKAAILLIPAAITLMHYISPSSILARVIPISTGWHTVYNYDSWWYWLNLINASVASAASIIILLFNTLRNKLERIRQRSKLVLLTIIPTFLGAWITGYAVRFFGIEALPPMLPIFVSIMVIGLAIALFRYDILELNTRMAVDPILASIYDAVVLTDPSGQILDSNLGASLHKGGPAAEDLLGQDISVLLPEATPASEWLATMAATPSSMKEGVFYFEPGRTRPAIVSVNAIHLHEDELLGYVVSAHDRSTALQLENEINSRLNADRELRKTEERFAIAFKMSPAGMFLLDADSKRVIGVNAAFAQLLCRETHELIGMSIFSLGFTLKAETLNAYLQQILLKTTRTAREYHITLQDGSTASCLIAAAPFTEDSKTTFMFTVLDITETNRLRKELVKAQKLESIGILAGGIAHDFNNIMTSILGNISLARLSLETGSENEGLLLNAETACVRARDLSRQLLTFSRGGEPNPEPVDILALTREAVRLATAGSSTVPVFNLQAELPAVLADRSQMQQVVSNIILNAVQMSGGKGTLRIQASLYTHNANIPHHKKEEIKQLKSGDYICLSFSDDGPGIPAALLPKIFDPYVSSREGGSGLGLAICYSVLKRHGGAISVESKEGHGATFSIYVPTAEMAPKEMVYGEICPGMGRILFMDDEFSIRKTTARMLERLGYEVVAQPNGESTLLAFKEAQKQGTPFCAVLLDLTIIGGMGGVETAARLRELDSEIPIYVTSGYSETPVMADFQKYGLNGFLPKPYGLEELSAFLTSPLQRNSTEPS